MTFRSWCFDVGEAYDFARAVNFQIGMPIGVLGYAAIGREIAEQDPVRLNPDRLAAGHHRPAPIDARKPMIWMDTKKLDRCPAHAHGLSTEALNEVGAALVDVCPGRGVHVAAWR